MYLTTLPFEIQVRILQLCSSNDLAALSRVQTSVRDVAEYVLYSHIHFRAPPDAMVFYVWTTLPARWKDDRSLFHTLAANPRKAAIVKAFYVQLEKFAPGKVLRLVLIKVAEALENMSNLVDLRILYQAMI